MLKQGDKAPDFTLPRDGGGEVSLSAITPKKAVLYFYPKDDTPGCTIEACDFTSGLAGFQELDAVVLGCSPDSPESHQKFIEKYDLEITLLSDPKHTVMEKYGAWGEKTLYGKKSLGVLRSTVLIDPSGKVAHHWKSVKAQGHAAKVAETLAKVRAQRG